MKRPASRPYCPIPCCIGLKASCSSLAFWYAVTERISSMLMPWAWVDLASMIVFILSWINLRRI
jgi:hypothetical protein